MNTPTFVRRKFARQALALAVPVFACLTAPSAFAGAFLHNGSGTYEYTDTANWGSGVIGNNWNANITADQTITFNQDYTVVTPPGGGSPSIIINANTSAPAYTQTFVGVGGTRTLTLGGSLALTGHSTNTTTTTFASSLNINLGIASGTRKFEAYNNRVLNIEGVISGGGGISREWGGTVRLGNAANTFTGVVAFAGNGDGGVLEVTKLANGGQDSSIGKSSNSADRLVFGGSKSAGTLRYVGSGDSTDRRFTIGGVGAKFDASGTNALNWTNTAAVTHNNAGVARTVTFLGTSAHANTMAAGFTDSGVGATSIKKEGSGRWILSGNNTYTGTTTIDAGTLELGSSNSGGNGSNLILNGGTFATGGFSETFGTLDVDGNATIDFGDGTSALVFGDSSGIAWGESISLSIINFTEGVDSIRFGINFEGLAGPQLGKITINGLTVAIDEQGYLSAIPEPSSFAGLAGIGGLIVAAAARRRAA
jgi:autotransporter-associated beta strand protein